MWVKNDKGRLKHSHELQITPDVVALERTVDASISSSTEIVLNKETTMLRVYAIAQDVYLKWGETAVTASNFDEVIPAGQIVDLRVPNQENTINVIERVAGATVIVIQK